MGLSLYEARPFKEQTNLKQFWGFRALRKILEHGEVNLFGGTLKELIYLQKVSPLLPCGLYFL